MHRRLRTTNGEFFVTVTGVILMISLVLTSLAAWITHVVVTIKTASWVLLVVGALFAPIGVIHGLMVWLGAV